MLGASGALLQPAESAGVSLDAGEAAASSVGAHQIGGEAQTAPGTNGGLTSSTTEIGDEDGKGSEGSGGGACGNRWPREETVALLKIRSDMDAVFRDSTLKSPLWEEVARKMAEMGYNRRAKKCREKFENVCKYHKRTKEGRASKSDGKTYHFFDQLESLFPNHHPSTAVPPPPPLPPQQHFAVPSTKLNPITNFPTSPSSSTSSDEEIHGSKRRKKRKRKWRSFFERLMKEMTRTQEDLHKKLLEAVEMKERDRTAREEAWKAQETARLNRQHEILIQERSMAAAKDAALVSFLQKLSDHHQIPPQPGTSTPINGDHSAGGSRWLKAEVEALIKLRTSLDQKYAEGGGAKGPLWEEISSEMKKIGYSRSAKRCKEKWENINKYFKKVKESNRKRLEDSKTCPYFHQLDAIYREKNKRPIDRNIGFPAAVMAQPEQQWPLPGSHDLDQDKDDDEDDGEESDNGSEGYEIVANNNNAPGVSGTCN